MSSLEECNKMNQSNTLFQKRYTTEKPNNKWKIFVTILIISALLGVSTFFIFKLYGNNSNSSQNSNNIIQVMSKITQLPNEDPTISTINDIATLQKDNPQFYKEAQNGDKVVIYSTKVYIYRPSSKKIINIANISIDDTL
jgi:hypothetical protein